MNTKERVANIAKPIVNNFGYEYVDTEFVKQGKDWLLAIYIDNANGVLIDDCEKVSRAVEAILDEEDFIEQSYCLCVSSPGLDRPLKTLADFSRQIGKCIDVKLYKADEGKKEYQGLISKVEESKISLQTTDGDKIFELKEIAKANLHIDF